MLSLQLKNGEYLTIGEDIVIQVFTNSTIKLYVTAPKDKTILRGEVLERIGDERPDCLFDPTRSKRAKRQYEKSTPVGVPAKSSDFVGRGGAAK